MENDYQISKDGTIFQILEDGTISKLAKIENGKVIASGESAPSENNTTGKGVLIFFLVAFAIATLVLGILYSQANDNYYSALSREYALEQKVSTLEESVTTLQEQLTQSRNRVTSINMQSSGYVDAEPGETFRISYTISPSTAKNVTINWSSTSPSVASVDANGIITAHQKGYTTIIARADGVQARCELEVRMSSSISSYNSPNSSSSSSSSSYSSSSQSNGGYNSGSSSYSSNNSSASSSRPMSISQTSASMTVGQRITLTAYNYGSSISWESDNSRVATVDSRGQVTAIGPGTTNIWAKGKEYKRCTVTVRSNSSYSSSSSSSSSSLRTAYPGDVYMSTGQSVQLKSLEGTLTKWESDNSRVATVTSTGVVRAVGRGETNIWGYLNGSPKRFFIHVN
jgi:uncharacterized protein YjdB